MLIGNSQAHYIIKTYLEAFNAGKHITPFLVLRGPSQVGKMSKSIEVFREQMGQFRHTDAKCLRNLSSILGKNHSFKVEVSTSDQHIVDKETGTMYENLGSRDLRGWLARAPLGDLKVVIIEDIDRMTLSAANALLKEFEEPLPGRLIVGTVDDGKQLLDTILSRAFLVQFHRVGEDELKTMIPSQIDSELHEMLVRLSAGAPGRLQELLNDMQKLETIQGLYTAIQKNLVQGGSIVEQMQHVASWNEQGRSNDQLLEMLLGDRTVLIDSMLIEGRKRLMSNVNQENVLWSVMLQGMKK